METVVACVWAVGTDGATPMSVCVVRGDRGHAMKNFTGAVRLIVIGFSLMPETD